MQGKDLDDLLAEAGRRSPQPSADLLARVLGDALDVQPLRQAVAAPRAGLWATLWAVIGGGPGFAGLSSAAMAGLWLGFAQPAAVSDVTGVWWPGASADQLELIPQQDDFFAEG